MAATIKTEEEIAILREGGRRLAEILTALAASLCPGAAGDRLEEDARRMIGERGDRPSFLGYRSRKDTREYPAALCLSVNDEVVHAPPYGKTIRGGDLVSLDLGLIHRGLFLDSAVTIGVGAVDERGKELLSVTRRALDAGIRAAQPGGTTGDIGAAVSAVATSRGFGVIRELVGHGVGYAVHEDPFVPNFGRRGEGAPLLAGMVIAIEPMFNEGAPEIRLDADGFTYRTKDGRRSAHFEHTVLITGRGPDVLTKI